MKKDIPSKSAPKQSGDMIPQHKRMAMGQPVNGGSLGGGKSPKK